MTYYIVGGSTYDNSEYKVYAYCDHSGYPDGEFGARPIDIYGATNDPYWTLGLNTETMASGQQHVELGLLDSWRIKITASGMWGYHTASGWMDILGGGTGGGDNLGDHIAEQNLDMLNFKIDFSTISGGVTAIDLNNGDIVNANDITFADYQEGLKVTGSTMAFVPESDMLWDLTGGINIRANASNSIRIWDRDADADSFIQMYYDKVDELGLRLLAQKDGGYTNKPLYLYDSSTYQPALYDNFPDDVTLGSKLGIGITPLTDLHMDSDCSAGFTTVIRLAVNGGALDVGDGPAILFKTSGNTTLDRYGAKIGAIRNVVSDNGSADFLIQLERSGLGSMEEVLRINNAGDLSVPLGAIVASDGLWTALTGNPDGYIWAVSGSYPTYGLYYNSGTPDYLEIHWNGSVSTRFDMEKGDMYLYDSTFADYVRMYHSGSHGYITTGGTGGGDLYLEPAGNVRSSKKIYNSVYNDYADYIPLAKQEIKKAGMCYYETGEGLAICNERNQLGAFGICSDTYGYATGVTKGALPISVAGIVLAYVDKVYKAGTILINNKDGILTKAKKKERYNALAMFMRKETKTKTKGVYVKDRCWVKVK